MSIDLNIGGWISVKNKLRQVIRVANQVCNMRITRGGAQDTITFSEDSLVIKLREMTGEGGAGVGGAGGNPGLFIYNRSEELFFFPIESVLEGYDPEENDNWSLEFKTDSFYLSDLNENPPFGTTSTERYDGDYSSAPFELQTFYRIPVVRTIGEEKYLFNISGIYREDLFCAGSKGSIMELIKIG